MYFSLCAKSRSGARQFAVLPPSCSFTIAVVVALVTSGCTEVDGPADSYPNRPIKVVVPFAAGGGTDTFARLMKRAIEQNDLLPQPLVIVNVGGASATIGSRRVKNARPDGYTVLLLHDAIVMAKYSGKVSYGPEAFEPVAGTSENGLVVAAPDDSPYHDLRALVGDAQQRPDEITFGCNLGTPTHFVGLLLEREQPAAAFRFVQTGDGAQRFAALKGGHIDVTVFSNEEFLRYQPEGIRALGFMGAERHPSMPDVPTAIEQGFDAEAGIMQYWWMPKGTPPRRVEIFARALREAMQTDDVRRRLAQVHSTPTFAEGPQLQRRLDRLEQRVAQVDLRKSFAMPNLPAIVFAAIVALTGVVLVRSRVRTKVAGDAEDKTSPRYSLAAACLVLTAVYVAALGLDLTGLRVGFRIATLLYVLAIGLCIAGRQRKTTPWIVALALVLSFGLHYVFTQVLVTDLP